MFILIHIGLTTYAQNITSTSSAESCIAYIDQLAKTAVARNDNWKHTAKFDGTSFTTTETGSSLIFIHETTDIDWTTFKSIGVGTLDDEKILVMIYFTYDFPKITTKVQIKDGGIKNKEFKTSGYIPFYFSVSQETKIKDLEAAAVG